MCFVYARPQMDSCHHTLLSPEATKAPHTNEVAVGAITYIDGMSLKRKKKTLFVFLDVENTGKNAEWSALANTFDLLPFF